VRRRSSFTVVPIEIVITGLRHCERSEAIHLAAEEAWIASSLRSSQ
jgi:hypothetical protein